MHLIDQQLELMIRGKFAEAWVISERLEKEMPDDMRHKFNRAWFILNQGDLQKGYQLLDNGRYLNVYGSPVPPTSKPLWNQKDSLKGKTVIINSEGGLGDEIIHARFAQDIQQRGGTAIISCSDSLREIFSTIPGVSKVINIKEFATTPHDYWVPGFSCCWLFGHTYKTLPNKPFLTAKPESVNIWKNVIKGDKPKIGIRWSGNPKFEHQQFRIFPAEGLTNLADKYPDYKFFSLQRDNDVKELPESITDLQYHLISWIDTLAAIQNLDLVITSCTSIAHAAASLGKPTWVILPILPYHIWAYGDTRCPWYGDEVRLYRQKKFGEWDDVFALIESELVEYFKDYKPEKPTEPKVLSEDEARLKAALNTTNQVNVVNNDGSINIEATEVKPKKQSKNKTK